MEAIKAIGTKKRVAALPAKKQPQYVIYNYFGVFGHLSIRLLWSQLAVKFPHTHTHTHTHMCLLRDTNFMNGSLSGCRHIHISMV
jgi:hypothetical protein